MVSRFICVLTERSMPAGADPSRGRDRRLPGARGAADRVVGALEPIDRERDLADAGRDRARDPLVGHLPRAGDDAAQHAAAADSAAIGSQSSRR